MLSIDRLHYSYDSHNDVLKDLSFTVSSGQIVGVMGANGAGKSTLIAAIAAHHRQSAITLKDDSTARTPLMTAYDEPKLYSYLSGRHFIAYILGLRESDVAFPNDLVAGFQLASRIDELILSYSFGTKRKVYLTTCLAEPCQVLQMDEPTNGLDALSVIFLKEHLTQLSESGTAVLLASHDLGFLEGVCDVVHILKDGSIQGEFRKGDPRGLEQVYLETVR